MKREIKLFLNRILKFVCLVVINTLILTCIWNEGIIQLSTSLSTASINLMGSIVASLMLCIEAVIPIYSFTSWAKIFLLGIVTGIITFIIF